MIRNTLSRVRPIRLPSSSSAWSIAPALRRVASARWSTSTFALAFVLAAGPAYAADVTFVVEGTVTSHGFTAEGTFSVGDPFKVVYTFESTTPDSDPATNRGSYGDAISSALITVGSYVATSTGAGNLITVRNDHPGASGLDDYTISLPPPSGPAIPSACGSPPCPEFVLGSQPSIFKASQGTAFSSDALPITAPDLGLFGSNFLALEFEESGCTGLFCDDRYVIGDATEWRVLSCGDGFVDGGEVCDAGASNGQPGSCCSSTCTLMGAGAECRASGGACDVAEVCDGASATCPADGFVGAGTVCRASGGVCDLAEACDGVSAICPADSLVAAGTECRASGGVCDVAETCDGSNVACPADEKSTAECRAANGVCDVAEICDGVLDDCPVDGFEPAGTDCADGDLCNGSETCDGSGTCQPDPDLSCDDQNPCTQDSCDPSTGCDNDPAPALTCADTWEKGQLLVNEKTAGKEKIVAKLIKGPALASSDFGDPVLGTTAYDVCVYDELGQLAGHLQVDRAGTTCAGKDCWKAVGSKGYLYKDRDVAADGVLLLKALGGDAGKSKILVKAKNNAPKGQLSMPTGITAALAGSTSATVQMHGSDSPVGCYSTTLTNVIESSPSFFKAK